MRKQSSTMTCGKCGGPKARRARHCKACHFAYFRPKRYVKKRLLTTSEICYVRG